MKAVSAPADIVRAPPVMMRSVGMGRYSAGPTLEECAIASCTVLVLVESEGVLVGVELAVWSVPESGTSASPTVMSGAISA